MADRNCYQVISESNPHPCPNDQPNCVAPCTHCEARPGRSAEEGRTDAHMVTGWNAGARSAVELSDANVRTVFRVGQAAGVILGFTRLTVRDPITDEVIHAGFEQTDPSTIAHGLYLWTQGGLLLTQVYESGAAVGIPVDRDADSEFEIRREGTAVIYKQDGDVIHRSESPSSGPLVVGCCMYATGDTVL